MEKMVQGPISSSKSYASTEFKAVSLSVQGRTNAVFNRALNAMASLNVHIVVASGIPS